MNWKKCCNAGTADPREMNLIPSLLTALALIVMSGIPALAALENRLDSLGPLKRYDPYAEPPQFLVKIHGKPSLGLPSETGKRFQRVSDRNWYMEVKGGVARMEPDYKTGEVMLKEVIEGAGQWCVSPDGKLIFACRQSERFRDVSECFDLETGESKWTFEKTLIPMDACFTPDGSQVAILHRPPEPQPNIPDNFPLKSLSFETIRKMTPPVSAAVCWYDAKSGELVRRVEIPGNSGQDCGSFMAFSGDRLYVTRPGNGTGGECFVIKPGSAVPEKIQVEILSNENSPRVEVGGVHGEFVTFYSNDTVVLFRHEADGTLAHLRELTLDRTSLGNPYNWGARFTPDGTHLVLSSCLKAIFISTGGDGNKEFLQGSQYADFSGDGKFYVAFTNGGGSVRDATTWEVVESFDSMIHPLHCCPVTEAGFSMSGNYIVSCDQARLLLWSKDGQELAELFSPRSDSNNAVWMQSPGVLEDQGKIYAADGYDFLVWDLAAIQKRLARKPDNIPRAKGEVVFRDRNQDRESPELMNIRIDAKGENIITAMRSEVRYRPMPTSPPIRVPVKEDEIFVRPRAFMAGGDNTSVIVRGYDAYTLDLTGKEKSVLYGRAMIGADIASNQLFCVRKNKDCCSGVWTHLIGKPNEAVELASFPKGWDLRPENAILSPNAKWIAAIPAGPSHCSVLSVIDVAKRQIIHSQPFKWTATSLSISGDGKRLLVGATNRCVYEFDFLKMTGNP